MSVRTRALACLTSLVLAGTLLGTAAPSVAEPTTPTSLLGADQAMAKAKASGQPVVASALTDEHTLITADPATGLMMADISAGIARVPDGNDGWREPSAALRQATDGSWQPEAAATQITVSDGGSGAFLSLEDPSAGSVSFSWPGSLPQPTIDGNLATYSEVAPGIDLVVRASVDGAESFLVVKSAEAAQNALVRTVPIRVTADRLTPTSQTNGAVTYADASGKGQFMLPPAYMWDSAGQAPGASVADLLDPAEGSRVEALSATVSPVARTASFTSESTSEAVTSMLDNTETVYPVVIDPSATLDQTYAVRVTQEFVKYNSDIGSRGKIGYNGWTSPYYKSRMFYQFKWPTYNGDYIEAARIYKAEFRYVQTHSPQHDCSDHDFGPSVKVQFYNTISGNTTWGGPSAHNSGSKTNDYAVGHEDYCHATYTQKWDVTSMAIAERTNNSGRTTVTVGILSSDESDKNGWREYKNSSSSPVFEVWYETTPPVPTALSVAPLTPTGPANVTKDSGPTLSTTVDLTSHECPDVLQLGCVEGILSVVKAGQTTPTYTATIAATLGGTAAPVDFVLPQGTLSDNTTYDVSVYARNVATDTLSATPATMTMVTDFIPGPSTITMPEGGWHAGAQLTVDAANADPKVSYRWHLVRFDAAFNEIVEDGTWERPAESSGTVTGLPIGPVGGYANNDTVTVTLWPIDSNGNEGASWVSDSITLH